MSVSPHVSVSSSATHHHVLSATLSSSLLLLTFIFNLLLSPSVSLHPPSGLVREEQTLTWTHTHTLWTALICIVWFVHWLIAVWNISSCPLWVKAWLKDRKTKTLQADKLSHQFRCSYCVNSLNRNLTLTCVWRQKDKTRQRLPCVFQLSRSMMFFL